METAGPSMKNGFDCQEHGWKQRGSSTEDGCRGFMEQITLESLRPTYHRGGKERS